MLKIRNKSCLEYMVERVQKANLIDNIIIATTTKKIDTKIIDFCIKNNLNYFQGSEEDVLERFFFASNQFNADIIVRLNSDCPLIDPKIIDQVIEFFLKNKYDYVSNMFPRPSTFPNGMSVEVFSSKALTKAFNESVKPSEREHVTPYIWNNSKKFKIYKINAKEDLSKFRLNLDYHDDYKLLKVILENLYSKERVFSLEEIIKFLEKNPKFLEINSHIKNDEGWEKSKNKDKISGYQ